jgi:hypothetical protein
MMKLATLTALLLALAASAPASVFTLLPAAGTVHVGQSFTIDVTATTDLMAAYQGDFSFDPSLLQVDNVVGSGDFAGLYFFDPIDNINGQVTNFMATWVGPGATAGTDVLVAQIFLTALAPGNATVSFAPAYVVTNPDTFATDPNVSANPANVTITPTPEPASIFTTLFAALGLVALKRKRSAVDR